MQKLAQFITKIIDFVYSPFQKYIPREIFRYGACGGGNMVLDWFLYFVTYNFIIGHELVYLHIPLVNCHFSIINYQLCLTPHIASLCIVFPITLLTGFWLNKYVTFTQSSLHGARQLFRYIMIVGVNLSVNYFGLKFLVESVGWYPTPSKVCITLFTVIISFLGQKYFTFRH